MSLLPVLGGFMRIAWPSLLRLGDASGGDPVEQRAEGALHGVGVVAAQTVEQAASDQAGDVAVANLDLENPVTALPALAKPRHADGAGTPAAVSHRWRL